MKREILNFTSKNLCIYNEIKNVLFLNYIPGNPKMRSTIIRDSCFAMTSCTE